MQSWVIVALYGSVSRRRAKHGGGRPPARMTLRSLCAPAAPEYLVVGFTPDRTPVVQRSKADSAGDAVPFATAPDAPPEEHRVWIEWARAFAPSCSFPELWAQVRTCARARVCGWVWVCA